MTDMGYSLSEGDERYLLTDYLGTTLAAFDAKGDRNEPTEATGWNVMRTSFGSGADSPEAMSRFTGKPYDADLGAHVFPYRNYRSDMGRWMSADPIGFPDGPNQHFYAPVPTLGVDPWGLATLDLVSGGSSTDVIQNTKPHLIYFERSVRGDYWLQVHQVSSTEWSVSYYGDVIAGSTAPPPDLDLVSGHLSVTVSITSQGVRADFTSGTMGVWNGSSIAQIGLEITVNQISNEEIELDFTHFAAHTGSGASLSIGGGGITYNPGGSGGVGGTQGMNTLRFLEN